jgi:hypothetical protein
MKLKDKEASLGKGEPRGAEKRIKKHGMATSFPKPSPDLIILFTLCYLPANQGDARRTASERS